MEAKIALSNRVMTLCKPGGIDGAIIDAARQTDHILAVDFRGNRFEVTYFPRVLVARCIPAGTGSEVLEGIRRGQPVLEPEEGTAVWCIATDWDGPKRVLETRFRLRALYPPLGSA